MTTELARQSDFDLDNLQRTASMMAASGYFDAARDRNQAIAQLAVKIMAGREMGYGPFASVQGIHVIQGKPSLSANIMAAAVKAHPRYDYRVRKMDNDGVRIEFFESSESLGISEFTADDAKKAGTQNMGKFARNMLFARALSNGVRWYCPDVFNGNAVYSPEELGASVDDNGDVIDVPAIDQRQDAPAQTQQRNGNGHQTQPTPEQPPASLDEVDELNPDPHNPFTSPRAGAAAEETLPYGDIADTLTGDCAKLATWAAGLHANGNGPATKPQYGFLGKTIDKATGDAHTVVLSTLCRRYVNADNPCSKDLAGKLLDFVLEEIPQKDAQGQSVKKDGKVVYVANPQYKPAYVECLKAIVQAVEAWRAQPVEA